MRCAALPLQLCPTLSNLMDCSLPAPLSMGFSRQEYCIGLKGLPPRDLPNAKMEAASLRSPTLGSLPLALPGKPSLVAIGVFKRSNSNSTKDKAFLLLCVHHILYTLVSLQQEHCNYSQLTGEKMEAYRCKIMFPMPALR